MRDQETAGPGRAEVSAYFEDGPHGGEMLVIDAEPDGSPPREVALPDPRLPPPADEEASLRHSRPVALSTYQLTDRPPRERGGYVYRLVRPRHGG